MTDRLHPDFGPRKVIAADVDGGFVINGAEAAEMARTAGTPQGRAFYRAYVAEWRKTEGLPLTVAARELRCMRVATRAIGGRLVDQGPLDT